MRRIVSPTWPSSWILGLGVAVLSVSVVERSGAHSGHAARAVESTQPGPAPAPVELRASSAPLPLEVYTQALARCMWKAGGVDTGAGGIMAYCPDGTAPITSGVYLDNYNDPLHHHLVNLSPGVNAWAGVAIDGSFDGEGLSDSHPQVHGEPPPDSTSVENFTNTVTASGTSIHYAYTGDNDPNDVRTLCCESLDQKSELDELENCRYESELVPVEPETDPDLAGQYVATLACSGGRHVTSGGCHAQFLHDSEWGLTGSHPYVDGDTLEHPQGPHGNTPGETGWACRLDREPFMWDPPTVYEEGIAITVLCCY